VSSLVATATEKELAIELKDREIGRAVVEALMSAYPGHPWDVWAEGGVVNVRHQGLSNRYGMTIKAYKVENAASLKKLAVMVGGEMLEIYRVSRGANGVAQAQERQGLIAAKPWLDKKAA